ncbi:hypothetical protein OC846_004929 [Tilletia horrida]|uniref:L domain-like protein n=1 Tax=Tilletia horrida TaxID=155126 RepID=A0AAN6JQD5_9BASI|nr:hypothetical protein OC846_004929 [Tilletia horrida]
MDSVRKQGKKRRREEEANQQEQQQEQVDSTEQQLYGATSLSLTNSPIKLDDPSIPPHLARFRSLTRLDLTHTGIQSTAFLEKAITISRKTAVAQHDDYDEYLGRRLTFLNLTDNPGLGSASIYSSPWSGLELLNALFVLHLTRCGLRSLPPLASLPNLRALILSHNEIASLPASFPPLSLLNTLVLSHNKLTTLPPTLPSSCPNLSKLSLTFNELAADSLPDFTAVLSLREVRLGNNPRLGKLPAHIANWGRGTDGAGKGLNVLELNNCGLYTFDQLSALLKVNPTSSSSSSQKGGLAVLNLKGNGVCEDDGYREKILSAHQHLRVLDEVRIEQEGAHGSKANRSKNERTKRTQQEGEDESDTARVDDAAALDSSAGPARKKQRQGQEVAEKADGLTSDPTTDAGKARQTSRAGNHGRDSGAATQDAPDMLTSAHSQFDKTAPPSKKNKNKHKYEAQPADSRVMGQNISETLVVRDEEADEQHDGSDRRGKTHRGSRGSRKKAKSAEGNIGGDAVGLAGTTGDSAIVPMAKTQALASSSTRPPKAAPPSTTATKNDTADLANQSGDQQVKKPKKLRQRQAKKLAQANESTRSRQEAPTSLAWDALPDQDLNGTETQQPPDQPGTTGKQKSDPGGKVRTSVVGIVEVKGKGKKADRQRNQFVAQTVDGPSAVQVVMNEPASKAAADMFGGGDDSGWGTGAGGDFWG